MRNRGAFLFVLGLSPLGAACSRVAVQAGGGSGLSAALVSTSEAPPQTQFYVAPDGNDANLGTRQSPFQSVARAQAAVRLVNASMQGDVVVWLRQGEYSLSSPLTLSAADSGSSGFFVRYKSYPGELATLSGGKSVTGWQSAASLGLNANIYFASAGGQRFRQLYVNGQSAPRARYPKASAVPYPVVTQIQQGQFRVPTQTAVALSWVRPNYLSYVQLVLPESWDTSKLNVVSFSTADPQTSWVNVDPGQGTVEYCKSLSVPPPSCLMTPGSVGSVYYSQQPFYFENALEFVSQPGEWFLDVPNDLVYIYAPVGVNSASDLENLGVHAPAGVAAGDNESLLLVQGTAGAPVTNVSFENLAFAYTNWLTPDFTGHVAANGPGLYRSAWSATVPAQLLPIPGAVALQYATNVLFQGNQFSNLGGMALTSHQGVKQLSVSGNVFSNVVSTALSFDQWWNWSSTTGASGIQGVTVTGNSFSNIGSEGYSASAAQLAGSNVNFSSNTVHGVSFSGVMASNGGLYYSVPSNENILISDNTIDGAAQNYSDAGGVYVLGNQPNLSVQGNVISNIPAATWLSPAVRQFKIGLYLDSGTQYSSFTGNVIQNVYTPFNQNCETENVISGNVVEGTYETLRTVQFSGCYYVAPGSSATIDISYPPGPLATATPQALAQATALREQFFPDATNANPLTSSTSIFVNNVINP